MPQPGKSLNYTMCSFAAKNTYTQQGIVTGQLQGTCQHILLKSFWLSDPEHHQPEGPHYWNNTGFHLPCLETPRLWLIKPLYYPYALGIISLMPHVAFWRSQCIELPGINLWVSPENHTVPWATSLPQQSLFLSLLWIPRQGTAVAASIRKKKNFLAISHHIWHSSDSWPRHFDKHVSSAVSYSFSSG